MEKKGIADAGRIGFFDQDGMQRRPWAAMIQTLSSRLWDFGYILKVKWSG